MLTFPRFTGLKASSAIGLIVLATLTGAQATETTPHRPEPRADKTLKPIKKWPTDTSVQQGMDAIRQAMLGSKTGIDQEQLSTADYQRLAQAIEKAMTDWLKKRQLPKEANTAFEKIVLGDLTEGAERMRTSQKVPMQRVGALGILQALRHYGEYFEHPGWTSLDVNQNSLRLTQ